MVRLHPRIPAMECLYSILRTNAHLTESRKGKCQPPCRTALRPPTASLQPPRATMKALSARIPARFVDTTNWRDYLVHTKHTIDSAPAARASAGMEAHVWIFRRVHRCHGQDAQVSGQGLWESAQGISLSVTWRVYDSLLTVIRPSTTLSERVTISIKAWKVLPGCSRWCATTHGYVYLQ